MKPTDRVSGILITNLRDWKLTSQMPARPLGFRMAISPHFESAAFRGRSGAIWGDRGLALAPGPIVSKPSLSPKCQGYRASPHHPTDS